MGIILKNVLPQPLFSAPFFCLTEPIDEVCPLASFCMNINVVQTVIFFSATSMSPKTAMRVHKPLQLIHLLCCSLSELYRAASWDQQVLPYLRCSGAQGETSPQHPVREMSGFKISVCSKLLGLLSLFRSFFLSIFRSLFAYFLCLSTVSLFSPFFLPALPSFHLSSLPTLLLSLVH